MQIQAQDYLYAHFLRQQNKILAITIAQIFGLPMLPETLHLRIPDKFFEPVKGRASGDSHWSKRIKNFFFFKKSRASTRNTSIIKDTISCSTAASTTSGDHLQPTVGQKRVKHVRFQEPKIALSTESVPDNNRNRVNFHSAEDMKSQDRDNAPDSLLGINLDALNGHPYEIVANPKAENEHNKHLYICRYWGCGKTFSKTYNLVYHFRVHTNEKPFECDHCGKKFSQKGNLGRHLDTHKTKSVLERKTFSCEKCNRNYTSIYNLRVSLEEILNDFISGIE